MYLKSCTFLLQNSNTKMCRLAYLSQIGRLYILLVIQILGQQGKASKTQATLKNRLLDLLWLFGII